MCGIFGIYSIKSSKAIDQLRFEESLMTMYHRGPDAQLVKTFGNMAILGHVRLSIIDLQPQSNQPFQIDNRFWIVYNGEIYNYIELRDELTNAGYQFRTSSDTEVLLKSYQHWGEECVSKFNGMWAFAIYDKLLNTLFCSRDRFGIKPFNYAIIDNQFVFASEIKAIIKYFPELKKPNYNVIANYCRTSVGAQHKETWFKGIFRLEPGHNLFLDRERVTKSRYWDYPKKVNHTISFDEAISTYNNILEDAIKVRMRSDVPIGFTLSSGIDSTSLVCLLKDNFNGNNHTYTASFATKDFDRLEKQNFKKDVEIDEPSIVKRLAADLHLEPKIIEIEYQNYLNDLRKIIFGLESGNSSPAIVPLFQVLNIAKRDVTVVIEGQGADELMGGYISNAMPIYIIELIGKLKFIKALKELTAFSKVYSLITTFRLLVRQSGPTIIKKAYFQLSGIESFFSGELKKYHQINDFPFMPKDFDNLLNKYLFKAHTGGLVNLLHYGDAISMVHTLESRLPYMDYRLVEFVFTLPSEYKINMALGKFIHRKAMENKVPEYILNNPIKFGFESPLSHLINEEDGNSIKSLLLSDKCQSRGLFSKEKILNATEKHKKGKINYSRILFRMASVELWFQLFIDE